MSQASHVEAPRPRSPSPLTLADRLIALAEQVDRAGFRPEAQHLIEIAEKVLDRAPGTPVASL